MTAPDLLAARRCTACGIEKPLTDFHRAGQLGWQRQCKPCRKEYQAAWRRGEIPGHRARASRPRASREDAPKFVAPELALAAVPFVEPLAKRGRPPWMLDALCLEYPDVNFWPDRGESTEPAKAVCAQCIVRLECLDYAVANHEREGVWGGTSGRERRRLRRHREVPTEATAA